VNIILLAAQFANEAHKGQTRKITNRPYIEHPMRVAGLVSLLPHGTEEMVAAAWLHDVVEDTTITLDVIEKLFGHNVAFIVNELTFKDQGLKNAGLNRAQCKAIQINKISQASKVARDIKVIDRIDNLTDNPDPRDPFFVTYINETKLLCEALKNTDTDQDLLAQLRYIVE